MSHLADRILALHGWAALAVIFLIPALESSAFLGFVFPGEIAVLLGGVMTYQGKVSLPAAIIAAIAGAVIGDTVGYEVGRHFGRRLLEGTIGRIVKHEHLDRAEDYLRRKGGRAVFLGRFTAALRVLIPGLAGMARLRYRTFLAYNFAGGALWASGFVMLGYLAGSGYHQVESVAKKASLLLLLLIVIIGGLVLIARRIARNPDPIRAFANRQLERPRVARLRVRYERQRHFVARRVRPEGALGLVLTASLVLIGLLGLAFGGIVQDVAAGESLDRVDRPVLHFLVDHREPWLTNVNKLVTLFGAAGFVVPLIVALGGLWWWRTHSRRPLLMLLGSWIGAEILFRLIKQIIGRPRPPLSVALGHFRGSAFPSGHATTATAVWGMAAALVAASANTWGKKVTAWACAGLLAFLVGVSRMYLGAHWATDVWGGWLVGSLWLFLLLTAARTLPARHDADA